MKRIRLPKSKKIIFAGAGAMLLFAVVAGVAFNSNENDDDDVIWREYPVERGDITASLGSSGTLGATGVQHGFDVDLTVEQILVELGQEVKAGDTLATYSKEKLQDKIDELSDSLGKAQRALADAKNAKLQSILQKELDDSKAGQSAKDAYEERRREIEGNLLLQKRKVEQLQAQLKTQEQDLKAAEDSEDGSEGSPSKEEKISALKEQIQQTKEDLETAQLDLNSQQHSLETLDNDYERTCNQQQENQNAKDQLDSIAIAGLDNAIENAQDEVDRIQEELTEAQSLLSTPVLTAKADGVVTEISYAQGEDVPAGKSIVTIGDSGDKHVSTYVSQEDIGSVEIGQSVEMQFAANPDSTVRGHVSKKSFRPAEGGDGVTYQVTIDFDEGQSDLMEGMTCNVKFILKKVDGVLTLANKAITLRDGRQYVTLKLPDGSHEEREIKTGFSDGRVSEVTSGLSEGDIVVVAG